MAVTHQRLLLLSLFLASALGQDAMAPAATPTVPRLRFEPALCPKLQGAEELAKASCGYLVVPENRSQQNYAVPTLRAAPDRIDGLAAGRPRPSRRSPWIG